MKADTFTPGCGERHTGGEREEELRTRLTGESEAAQAAAVFSLLADPTRVRLLCMLADSGLCVCEMSDLLGMSQPAVSHHLRVLRRCDAIRFRKDGQRTIYFISGNTVGDTIRRLLQTSGCGKV